MKQHKTSDQTKAAYITAPAVILAAIIGGVFAILNNNHQSSSSSSPHTLALATSLTSIPPTDTLVHSSTPTSKVIPINRTMTCTNCTSGGYNFSLIVKEATIDPVKNQVTLLVAVQNNTSDSFSPYINYLRLQDMQTADTYDGTGDGFSNFDITAHQTILFRITYQFLPVAGHTYSLSCNLSREFDLSPITIKFY